MNCRALFTILGLLLTPPTVFLVLAATFQSVLGADVAAPASPEFQPEKGGVLFTFDDRNFDGWLKAQPLFDKYGAKATFFVSGNLDSQAMEAVEQLRSRGHAIGVHGVHHLTAVDYCKKRSPEEYVRNEVLPQVEQLKAAKITPTAFAYPSSRRNDITDGALLKIVRHVRTGLSFAPGEKLSGQDIFFVRSDRVGRQGCLYGKGIDAAPTREDRTYEQIDAGLERAARNHEVIVLYAHSIGPPGRGHSITPEALEHFFRKATELQLPFYTFDQLP